MISGALTSRIAAIIREGRPITDVEFNELSMRLLVEQRNASRFLDRFFSGALSAPPVHWSDIPGLPTSAFKRTAVRTFPEERIRTYFQTSGTTEGESGRHYFETLEFYEAAIVPNFKAHLLPDHDRMHMIILTPSPEEAPHSSLVHMMRVVTKEFGTSNSGYFLRDGVLQLDDIIDRLLAFQKSNQPVFLLGTAFAFVYFLDALSARGQNLILPPGSRIMETGGFKGRTREVEREAFYRQLNAATGIPSTCIVNEYGMTELSSQFYDRSIVERSPTANKSIPEWTRIVCIDPLTNQPVPNGTPGLIRVYDLANIGSCCVLQTEDAGVIRGDSFEVFGRVAFASPRGCSLGADSVLSHPG